MRRYRIMRTTPYVHMVLRSSALALLCCLLHGGLHAQTTVRGNDLRLYDGTGNNSVRLAAPTTLSASYSVIYPSAPPATGSILYGIDASGQLAWTNPPVAGQILVSQGSALTPTWMNPSSFVETAAWTLGGNAGTDSTHFLGTRDARPLSLRTKNLQRVVVDTAGNVGIGTTGTVGDRLTVHNGNLLVSNSGTRGELRLQEASANGSNYIALRAPSAMASNVTLTLPATEPSAEGNYLRASSSPTNLEWSDIGIARFIRKTADQNVQIAVGVLGSVVENDDDLKASVVANATYVFDLHIRVNKNAVLNVGDFVCSFTGPTGATGSFGYMSSGALIQNAVVDALGINTGAIGVTLLGNGTSVVSIRGIITTGNTSGTLQFRWGINAAAAVLINMYVRTNSYMTITRVS